ncbi:phosphonate ABC transporter, permease protein PhnE [Liberiplasma polymorphum]|uniref:phosphonate ABC transporter, permease protein PhnE n=1 Tax=Liberiplasma polymorphum TaxID=3374570 RepID=UPI00377656B2
MKQILTVEEMYEKAPKRIVQVTLTIIILFGLTIWSASAIKIPTVNQSGLAIIGSILKAFTTPNWDWLLTLRPIGIPYQMLETVAIAFLGTALGAVLAIPLAFITAKNTSTWFFSLIGILSVTMIRTFPVFILGLMFIRVTGPGPFAGVMTIGLASIGMMTKLYVESIEDIDKGVLEALDATGATLLQKIRYGIIPQLSANFISNSIYRFEINVRNATILGLVGAGGIGSTLIWAMNAYRWKDASAALWGIIIVVLVIEVISTKIRKKITTGE